MSMSAAVFRFGGISLGIWYLTRTILSESLPAWASTYPLATALTLGGFFTFTDVYLLYPYFYSPLRKLPTVYGFAVDIVAEVPRGATPLKWFQRYPDADMIRMRDTFGVERLFVASPSALRDIMSTSTYDFEKPWNIRAFLARVIGFGLILSEGSVHKKQRRALTPAFNVRNIRNLYGFMWEKTGVLLSQLQQEMTVKGQVEMSGWASRLTLDIIGPAALSRDFRSMTNNDVQIAEAFSAVLEPSRKMVFFLALNLLFPQWLIRKLPLDGNRIVDRECGFLRNTCRSILHEKHQMLLSSEKKSEEEADILTNIISSGEFNDDEIIDEMLTFLAAGHETTASALTWCCYLLSQESTVQTKLREEIREAIPSSSAQVTHDMLESMPYLNGVCEEVLRLFPTVPTTIREAQRRTMVAGILVPAWTLVVISIYAINRNPRFWGPDADKMVPERWIETQRDGTRRPNKHGGTSSNFCETTFLHGQRSCIGRDFAKAELRCAIAGIFGKFKVEMVDPNEKITIAGSVTTKPREGMRLRLRTLDGW